MTTNLAKDTDNNAIQALRPSPDLSQSVTAGVAATALGTPLDSETRVIRIISTDQGFHYNVNGAAATSDPYLPAGVPEYLKVNSGDAPQFIRSGDTDATVIVTEMEG